MRWRWREETDVPSATGVVGCGAVARALFAKAHAAAIACEGRQAAVPWQVTAHQDLLLLTGPADALPWVAGARYAAPRADAPTLWLPTLQRPDIALDLLAAAIARRHAQKPLLLWPDPAQLVPLHRLLPADTAVLARIAAHWDAS